MSSTTRALAAECMDGFTRREYAQLPEGLRTYLLDGMFVREPAPTWRHQSVGLAIARRLELAAPGRVLVAPADIVIDDRNVLQPDVMAFEPGVHPGGDAVPESIPVLVVEVLSPSTARLDRRAKTARYLRAGVREVWLVDPDSGELDVVTRQGTEHHGPDDIVTSRAVPGFDLAWPEIDAAARGR